MTDLDQLPPHDPPSERALLGALLYDRDAIADVAGWLTPEAFFSAANATIYRAMLALWRAHRPADLVTLGGLLHSRNLLDGVGGRGYLADLLTATPTAAHAPFYAKTVMELAARRELIQAGSEIVKRAYAGDVAVEDLVGGIRRAGETFALPAESDDFSLDAHRLRTLQRWEGTLVEQIVPTGIASIDRRTFGGFRGGELVYIGARPGMGKTAVALQAAMTAAKAGIRPLIVELEMSREAVFNRLIAAEANVPFAIAYQTIGDVRKQDAWLHASERVEELPLSLETKLFTTDRIAAYCEKAANENPVGIIFIDHLDYLADPDLVRLPTEQRTAETSKRLRRIANDLQVPIVGLVQLNRAVEAHPPFKPALNHFRYSGAIEQDADHAFLLYRRLYYVAKGMLEQDANEDYCVGNDRHKVELLHAKNRNGDVGSIELAWIPDQMKFVERSAA